ncbi:MAG: hypothetical protein SPI35_01380 [Porphyromonas sp.]|nr:hypothetical protein [Porphyromonas sp.]
MSKDWNQFKQRQGRAERDLQQASVTYDADLNFVRERGSRYFVDRAIEYVIPKNSPLGRSFNYLSGTPSSTSGRQVQKREKRIPAPLDELWNKLQTYSAVRVATEIFNVVKPLAIPAGLTLVRSVLRKRFRLARLFL